MKIAIYAVLALAIMAMIATGVAKVKAWGASEVKAEWDAAVAAQKEVELLRSRTAAKELAEERAKKKTVVRWRTEHVERIIDRPVYRNLCFDADGLCLANAALLGKNAAGCKPDGGMPAPDRTD
jgi:hypothetical protein